MTDNISSRVPSRIELSGAGLASMEPDKYALFCRIIGGMGIEITTVSEEPEAAIEPSVMTSEVATRDDFATLHDDQANSRGANVAWYSLWARAWHDASFPLKPSPTNEATALVGDLHAAIVQLEVEIKAGTSHSVVALALLKRIAAERQGATQ